MARLLPEDATRAIKAAWVLLEVQRLLVKATPAADRRSGQETHNNPPALSRALERSAESVIGSLLSRGPS